MSYTALREFAQAWHGEKDDHEKLILVEATMSTPTKADDGFRITMNDRINTAEHYMQLAKEAADKDDDEKTSRYISKAATELMKGRSELTGCPNLELIEAFTIASILAIVPTLLLVGALTGIGFVVLSIPTGLKRLSKAATLKLFGIKTSKGYINDKQTLVDAYDDLISECREMSKKLKPTKEK